MNRKFSCLLVSLQPDDRSLMEEALGPVFPHLQVRQVTDAPGWRQALAAGDFDLGIIAEPLPWADHASLLQELKSSRPDCPVIMLAAPEQEEAAMAALRRGLDDYVLRSPEEMRRLPRVVQAAGHRARYRFEEACKGGEGDFRTLFDAVPQVIFVHDPETGLILDANQEACLRLGYTREEFKNLNIGAISLGEPPFTEEEALRQIRKTVEEGVYSGEWLGRDKAGKPIWVEVSAKSVILGGHKRVLSFGRNISSRKRDQEALREAETRYETLLDSAGDAIFIHDTAGRLLQVNDAACRLLGYTRAELQQMTLKDIAAPSHPSIQRKIRESTQRGHVFVETALRRREGTAVLVELSSRLIEYSGVPVAFSIARDITARRETEEKLRESEIKYRSIFETTGTATCIDDADTTLSLVNAEFAKLCGCPREELEGKASWAEFIVPEDLERLKEYHRLRLANPQAAPGSFSFRFKDRQGQVKDILATVALIPGTSKTVASLLDITARQDAEKALRESEVRYRLLVETMNDGLGMLNAKGLFTFVSSRFCEILGYAKEELLNLPLTDFLDPANKKIFKEQMKFRKKGGRQPYEITWTGKNGTSVTTAISPVPLFDAADRFKGSFAVVADITARQQAERALRESEEKYRAIFENSGTAMAILEDDTTISLVNAEHTKLSGYSREELEGKISWTAFHTDDDLARMREYHRLRRIDPHLAPRNYEAHFIDRFGEVKDILLTVDMIPGTLKSVAALLDITARKKAEHDLDFERKRFQTLAENSPFAMVMIGQDGSFKYVNPKFIELFGYDLGDVPNGRTWFRKAFPDPAYRHEVISDWIIALERAKPGEKRPRTFTVTCKDGATKIISFISLLLDNGDHLTTCEDITERKRAEEALRQSEERYRAMVEDQTEMVTRFLPDGTVTFANETVCRYVGKSREELIDNSFYPFIPEEDRAAVQRSIAALNQETPFATLEHQVFLPNGRLAWQQWTNRAIFDNQGRIIEFQGVGRDITERKRAEESLRESERLHASILDTMPDIVYELSLDGHLLYANRAFTDILGYSLETIPAITLKDLVEEEGLQKAFRVIGEMAKSGQPSRTEFYQLRTARGRFVPIETNAIVVARSNQPATIVGVARDITARLRGEQALRQAEAEKSLILENMSEMVTYRDRDNRILWANPAAAVYFGLTPDEMVGRFCFELFHQRSGPCPGCLIIEANAAGQAIEAEIIRDDGRIISTRTSPVKDEHGEVQGMVVVASDITARKKAEEVIKASEEKMRLVIESSPVGVRIIQQDRYLYVNPALIRMFGYDSAGEIMGQPVNMLFNPEDWELLQEKKEAALAGKPEPASFEAGGLKKDGARLDVQVWQTEIDYQDEPALLEFILDFSEAKALRSQLLQAQKMEAIGTLAGGIAHDFNNILFPILVNTEMVLEDIAPDNPSRQRLSRVLKACWRARDLVKQILVFSRHEERELIPVRLIPIINDSLRLLRASLPATIEMRQNLGLTADIVLADTTQIQQVLINLYTNAAHAMGDREGLIEISLTEAGGRAAKTALPPDLTPGPYLQLTVRDNGHGMDPATLERIFDPYFTTKKLGEGTGLGLAMVHGIVKRHGGAITVDSEPGKGSSFHMFLPRIEAEILQEPREFPPFPQGQGRILVVDDEAEIAMTLQQMLERLGYRVEALTSSLAALDTFRTRAEEFDLVITDQTMPHLTGADLAREMLKLRPDLPVILCTGFSEVVSREKAQALGIREFIIKPIATRAMAETVQRVLMSRNNGS